MKNLLVDLLSLQYPIIQAPIGSASNPMLAAAVSEAGGLGMLALSWVESHEIRVKIKETRRLTQKAFGVNFVLAQPILDLSPFLPRLEICLEEKVPLISLAWGSITSKLVTDIHQAGSLVSYTVWNAEQAVQAIQSGVDILVLQGMEAGGHLNSNVSTMTLISQIHSACPFSAIVAAGGIGNGIAIRQAINAGASGVWMGTRFLASQESLAHESYKQRLVNAQAKDTVMNTLYKIGWPDAPHRTLKNSTFLEWERNNRQDKIKEETVVANRSDGTPIYLFEDVIPLQGMTGNLEALPHYAGCSVSDVKDVQSARNILNELVLEAGL